jgi:hypothetical protein
MTGKRSALMSVGRSHIAVCTKLLTASDFCKAGTPVSGTNADALPDPQARASEILRAERKAGELLQTIELVNLRDVSVVFVA